MPPALVKDNSKTGASLVVDSKPEQHVELLDYIVTLPCKIAISHYRHPLYDNMLEGWTRHDFDMPNHSGQGKTKERRTECLWTNYRS